MARRGSYTVTVDGSVSGPLHFWETGEGLLLADALVDPVEAALLTDPTTALYYDNGVHCYTVRDRDGVGPQWLRRLLTGVTAAGTPDWNRAELDTDGSWQVPLRDPVGPAGATLRFSADRATLLGFRDARYERRWRAHDAPPPSLGVRSGQVRPPCRRGRAHVGESTYDGSFVSHLELSVAKHPLGAVQGPVGAQLAQALAWARDRTDHVQLAIHTGGFVQYSAGRLPWPDTTLPQWPGETAGPVPE